MYNNTTIVSKDIVCISKWSAIKYLDHLFLSSSFTICLFSPRILTFAGGNHGFINQSYKGLSPSFLYPLYPILKRMYDTWENGWRCKSEVCAREDDNKKWIFSMEYIKGNIWYLEYVTRENNNRRPPTRKKRYIQWKIRRYEYNNICRIMIFFLFYIIYEMLYHVIGYCKLLKVTINYHSDCACANIFY